MSIKVSLSLLYSTYCFFILCSPYYPVYYGPDPSRGPFGPFFYTVVNRSCLHRFDYIIIMILVYLKYDNQRFYTMAASGDVSSPVISLRTRGQRIVEGEDVKSFFREPGPTA